MLSSIDLKKYFANGTNFHVCRYQDLHTDFDIEHLLSNRYIILYPGYNKQGKLTPNVGHYIALWGLDRNGIMDVIHFFDSYGKKPDMQVIGKEGLNHYNKLINLLYNNRKWYKIHYNPYRFQYDDYSCGYWCGIRLKLNHLSDNSFKKFVKTSKMNVHELYDTVKGLY